MKPFDFSRVREYKFALLVKPLFRIVFFLFFRVRVIGKANIPKNGGFIAASNHISGADPAFTYMFLKTPIHYMSKQELFKNPYIGWIFKHLNGFPVTRGTANKRAVEYAIKVVEQGNVLGIFPEGTRSKDFTPQPPKTGVALIARETKAGVLPVSIYSAEKIKPFCKITVRFGQMIPCETFGFGNGVKSDELKVASGLIMDSIIALWALKHSK